MAMPIRHGRKDGRSEGGCVAVRALYRGLYVFPFVFTQGTGITRPFWLKT